MYVLIAGIAVFPIAIAFKVIVDRIKADRMPIEKGQVTFLITAAVIEIIPIILIVYMFSQEPKVASMDDLIVPGLLVLVFMAIGAFFIFLQGVVGVTEDKKKQLTVFSLIAISLSNAIPIVSLVGLFMMMA